MSKANDVAVELQSKYDYFFAAAILASVAFTAQLDVEPNKLSVICHITALIAFALSAVCSLYRLQQKPRIYELIAKADDARKCNRAEAMNKAESMANEMEEKYANAYTVMCVLFVAGAIAIGVARMAKPLQLAFS